MSRVRVLVGTKKGAFILTADGKRQQWDINGLATCLEYLLMVDLGFDQWVLVEPLETVGSSIPGRMGINTAICFLIVGLALALKILAPGRLEAMSDGFSLGATLSRFYCVP